MFLNWLKSKTARPARQIPAAPSPQDVEPFVKWLLRYGADFEPLREPYSQNLDTFVALNWKEIEGEIEGRNLKSGEALLARARVVGQFYVEHFEEAVHRQGIARLRPLEYQATAVGVLAKLLVLTALAEFTYGMTIPQKFPGLRDG